MCDKSQEGRVKKAAYNCYDSVKYKYGFFLNNQPQFLKPHNYKRITESERVLATTAERQRASPPDTQTSTENWREKLHSTSPTSE